MQDGEEERVETKKREGDRGGEGKDGERGENEGGDVKQSTRSGQMLRFRVKLSSHYHTTLCVYV